MLDDYAEMIAQHDVWVIREDGQVIASLVLMEKPSWLLLDNVAVHPDFGTVKTIIDRGYEQRINILQDIIFSDEEVK